MSYLIDDNLSRLPGLVHGFGTKDFREADIRELARRRVFRLALMDQVHSDIVHIIEDAPTERPQGDALVTNVPGLLLAVKTADCLPVLLADQRLRAVAAVHAGWRGTRSGIVRRAVLAMKERFGTNPAEIIAALGPCIGASCYEVGEDVRGGFISAGFSAELFVPAGRPDKYFLDLKAANVRELRAAGVTSFSPAGEDRCTHCDPRFHSWRRDRDAARRMFSFIGFVRRESTPQASLDHS